VLHIANLLSDPDTVKEASLHYLGNLGVQRMLEAMAKLRLAFPPSRPNPDLDAFRQAHKGRDPFGRSCEHPLTPAMMQ